MNISNVFSYLRQMSGGKLTQEQVDAGDAIVAQMGVETFAQLIAYKEQGDSNITLSEDGANLIKQFEGFRGVAYRDTGGVWTIGYGTIRYPNGVAVKQGDTCTKEQADVWFNSDVQWVKDAIRNKVRVPLSQNQYDALASFIYNVGETAFNTSTLLAKLNRGDYIGASNEFGRWVNDNGQRIQGLVNRRKQEQTLFLA